MATTVANAETIQKSLVSALERYEKTDMIQKSIEEINAYAKEKRKMGMNKSYPGGPVIRIPISKEENSSFQFYNDMEVLDIKRTDVFTVAQYVPTQATINVSLSMRQILDNKGDTQAFNLVKAARDNARTTIANNMSRVEYGSKTRASDPLGLQNHFSDDGLGRVGTIDSSSVAVWRNQFQTTGSGNPSFEALMKGLDLLRLDCSFGTKPNLILISNDWWQIISAGMRDIMRTAPGSRQDTSVPEFNHMGAKIVHDFNSNFGKTAQRAYYLNTKTVCTYYHEDQNWKTDKQMKPIEQNAIVVPMHWMGQNVVINRKYNGLLTA